MFTIPPCASRARSSKLVDLMTSRNLRCKRAISQGGQLLHRKGLGLSVATRLERANEIRSACTRKTEADHTDDHANLK